MVSPAHTKYRCAGETAKPLGQLLKRQNKTEHIPERMAGHAVGPDAGLGRARTGPAGAVTAA
eukprot:363075-Chlamydomonas_euryale.AAC.7